MNTFRLALMIVILISVAILAGCQEGQARDYRPTGRTQVALVPSATGFWQARVSSPGSR